MVLEPTIGLILVELIQIAPLYTHHRGRREAEAKGDAGPREERSYGHGKAQPGPGRSTHIHHTYHHTYVLVVFGGSKVKMKTENGAFSKFTYFEIALYNS